MTSSFLVAGRGLRGRRAAVPRGAGDGVHVRAAGLVAARPRRRAVGPDQHAARRRPGVGGGAASSSPSPASAVTGDVARGARRRAAVREPRSGRAAPADGGAAAGSTYIPIVFTNNSGATCTLYGYPGVSLAGGNPVGQIGVAADENPATPRQLVTLAPGAAASALLRIVAAQNYPAARCHRVSATYLQVYPPNQTTPIYVRYSSTACTKPIHLLTVNVVKPGTGG